MTLSFTSDGIRAAGRQVAGRATSAVSAAKGRAQVTIGLPPCLADQQRQLNELLSRVPSSFDTLQAMAMSFEAKAAQTADRYAAAEADNTTQATGVEREI